MTENKPKKVKKKGRKLAVVALIIGIASFPLFFVDYIEDILMSEILLK